MFQCIVDGGADLRPRQRESALEFVDCVRTLQRDLERPIDKGGPGLSQALSNLIKRTRYEEWIISDEGTETSENSRLSNLRELIRTCGRFRTAREFLDYVDDLADKKKKRKKEKIDAVQVMTIHKSKGLEFPAVFLVGCAEKILPHARAEDVEEERRIFYVGVTRARDRLVVTCPSVVMAAGRTVNLEVSRFVKEAGLLADSAEIKKIEDSADLFENCSGCGEKVLTKKNV